MSIITKVSDILYKVEKIIVIFFCTILLISLSSGVLFRYVFSKPLIWSDELALFCLAWVTFIGGSIGLKKRLSPSITIITDSVSTKFRKPLLMLSNLTLLIFILYVLYLSIIWITGPTISNQFSTALNWPKFYFYLSVPISFAFMSFHVTELLLNSFREDSGYSGGSIQ